MSQECEKVFCQPCLITFCQLCLVFLFLRSNQLNLSSNNFLFEKVTNSMLVVCRKHRQMPFSFRKKACFANTYILQKINTYMDLQKIIGEQEQRTAIETDERICVINRNQETEQKIRKKFFRNVFVRVNYYYCKIKDKI